LTEDPFSLHFAIRDDAHVRDIEVHRLARATLLEWLRSDSRVVRLFNTCEGMAEQARQLAAIRERMARFYGFADQQEMIAGAESCAFPESPVLAEMMRGQDALFAKYPLMLEAVDRFVAEIWREMDGRHPRRDRRGTASELPWPWLRVELGLMFRRYLDSLVLSQPPAPVPVLGVQIHGDVRVVADRKGAFENATRIRRDVEYVYRCYFQERQTSIRALAKQSGNDRTVVYEGIERGLRVLAEVPSAEVFASVSVEGGGHLLLRLTPPDPPA